MPEMRAALAQLDRHIAALLDEVQRLRDEHDGGKGARRSGPGN